MRRRWKGAGDAVAVSTPRTCATRFLAAAGETWCSTSPRRRSTPPGLTGWWIWRTPPGRGAARRDVFRRQDQRDEGRAVLHTALAADTGPILSRWPGCLAWLSSPPARGCRSLRTRSGRVFFFFRSLGAAGRGLHRCGEYRHRRLGPRAGDGDCWRWRPGMTARAPLRLQRRWRPHQRTLQGLDPKRTLIIFVASKTLTHDRDHDQNADTARAWSGAGGARSRRRSLPPCSSGRGP